MADPTCDIPQYTNTVHDYEYEYSAYEYEYEYRVLHLCQINCSNYITNTTFIITVKIYTEIFSSPQESEQKYHCIRRTNARAKRLIHNATCNTAGISL